MTDHWQFITHSGIPITMAEFMRKRGDVQLE